MGEGIAKKKSKERKGPTKKKKKKIEMKRGVLHRFRAFWKAWMTVEKSQETVKLAAHFKAQESWVMWLNG